jgi:hypothetical protein
MDPVSNTDRIVRQIRRRLEERSKAEAKNRSTGAAKVQLRGPAAVNEIAGPIARGGLEDDKLQRLVIEQLLADQFGPNLVNDTKFQQIVDQVTQTMLSDAAIGDFFMQAIAQLRRGN